jgi:hypothetical protein
MFSSSVMSAMWVSFNKSPIIIVDWEVSAHFDDRLAESGLNVPAEDVDILTVLHEVDGINPQWKNDLKASCMVVLNLQEFEVREGVADIIFSGLKVALDQIQ